MEQSDEMEKIIRLALIKIGIKCDLKGYFYLTKAIKLVIDDPLLVFDMKSVYKKIAQIYKLKDCYRVEANVLNAINYMFESHGIEGINALFKMEILKSDRKPNVAEFIQLICEYYSLGLYNDAN